MTSQDYSWGFTSWIRAFYMLCAAGDYCIVRTVVFAYHCSRLCMAIQELIDIGNRDALLAIYPSILHHLDNVESQTAPLYHERPLRDCAIDLPTSRAPLPTPIPDSGLLIYQSTFRLQLSMQVHGLLSMALEGSNCTPEQHAEISEAQMQCTKEYQALADRLLAGLAAAISFDKCSGTSSKQLGLLDVFQMVWPLQLIASSPLSSDCERRQARMILEGVHNQIRLL